MKATFTDEQQLLAELSQRLAERIGADAAAAGDPGGGDGPAAGWSLLVESGLIGLRLRVAAGGSASSAVEVAIVAEALGRHLAPTPFVGPVLAAELLSSADAPTDLLEAIVTGRQRVTVAFDPSLSHLGRLDADGDRPNAGGDGNAAIGWDARGAESLVGVVEEAGGTVRVGLSDGIGSVLASSDLARRLVTAPPAAPTAVGRPFSDAARLR